MKTLLPYQVVRALIMDQKLHEQHLTISAQFATVARALYVDNEPHQVTLYQHAALAASGHAGVASASHLPFACQLFCDCMNLYGAPLDGVQVMTRVNTIRQWDYIAVAAASGKLSSRLITNIEIEWDQFDELKDFISGYLQRHAVGQIATHLGENRMSLELIKLVYSLLELGFYTSKEVATLLPTLLDSLDGTRDRVGVSAAEDPRERYRQIQTIRVSTVDVIECKLWLCKVLQLVVTMRLDIRLSLLLGSYQKAWNAGHYGSETGATVGGGILGPARRSTVVAKSGPMPKAPRLTLRPPVSGEPNVVTSLARAASKVRRRSLGYLRLLPESDMDDDDDDAEAWFRVLRFDATRGTQSSLVHVLRDLTFYEHPELVTAALGLLVRHFEQRSVLIQVSRRHCSLCHVHAQILRPLTPSLQPHVVLVVCLRPRERLGSW